ncbi:MAG: hypothetical protein C6W55_16095 [Thermobacillus sp.]|uniref:ABC transporter substrate-binding protein n=1 Tax=Thermobacillus sp. TaxID=2108467 RepID=UPI000E3A20C9|nr:ABC transporter substrate-binding protein [Thermobacillus sp.]REK52502.1 MAG: hypothetical protein C6W55_16095 [Thermobacillus sp.]
MSVRMKTAAALFAAMLLLAACQSGIVQPDATETSYSGTLRVALFGGYSFQSTPYPAGNKPYPIHDRIKAFMEQNPNVQIEVTDFPSLSAKPTAVREALDDPDGYDIIEMNIHEARLAGNGRLSSLESRIQENKPRWDGDYAKVIEQAEIDGIPYLLPVRSDPMMVYYDRLAFAQLGLPEPREGWPLEEFASAANRLAEAGLSVAFRSISTRRSPSSADSEACTRHLIIRTSKFIWTAARPSRLSSSMPA